jgi:hypothetical protein
MDLFPRLLCLLALWPGSLQTEQRFLPQVSLKSPPPYMSVPYPLIASMSPLSHFFLLLPFSTFIRSGFGT